MKKSKEVKAATKRRTSTAAAVEFSRKRSSGNDPRHWWRLGAVNGPSGSAASRPSTGPDIPAVPL